MRNSSLVERYCAENVTGLKVCTEAAAFQRPDVRSQWRNGNNHLTTDFRHPASERGRGAFLQGRSHTERDGGPVGRENAGISNERQVRILPAESLRFSGEGSSAQSKPGPKPRQKCVGDGQSVENPMPL